MREEAERLRSVLGEVFRMLKRDGNSKERAFTYLDKLLYMALGNVSEAHAALQIKSGCGCALCCAFDQVLAAMCLVRVLGANPMFDTDALTIQLEHELNQRIETPLNTAIARVKAIEGDENDAPRH